MRFIPADVPEGPRARLLALVRAHPGTHLRGIERLSGLPLGQVLYHLDRLERMSLIASSRDGGFRRYFATGDIARSEKKYLAALRHEVPMRILLEILGEPRLTHKELQARLGVAGSTVSFHLQRLLAAGVLKRERVGVSQEYEIAEPDVLRRELLAYRESFALPPTELASVAVPIAL